MFPGVLTFRVDRVRSLRRTGDVFDRDAYPSVDPALRLGPDLPMVTLRLPPSARWVVETYPTESVTPADDDSGALVVRLGVTGLPWLERLLLRVGPEGRVEEPEEWRSVGRDVAARLLARYS